MGNSLRCCLACVLPCGALDLIRIVHLNGYVEEITRPIIAGEFLQSYPNHILSKPCSQGNNMVRKIMILSYDSELKRGNIYFLLPNSSLPSDHSKSRSKNKIKGAKSLSSSVVVTNDNDDDGGDNQCNNDDINNNNNVVKGSKILRLDLDDGNDKNGVVCDTKIKSKSKSGKHQRRRSSRGKSGIWQPHLESITEDL